MFTLEKIPGLQRFWTVTSKPGYDRNRTRTWACFSPRNLPKKFRPDPSTFYLVIVVTDKQRDRQTNAGDYIIPRESFRGDKNIITTHVCRSVGRASRACTGRSSRRDSCPYRARSHRSRRARGRWRRGMSRRRPGSRRRHSAARPRRRCEGRTTAVPDNIHTVIRHH